MMIPYHFITIMRGLSIYLQKEPGKSHSKQQFTFSHIRPIIMRILPNTYALFCQVFILNASVMCLNPAKFKGVMMMSIKNLVVLPCISIYTLVQQLQVFSGNNTSLWSILFCHYSTFLLICIASFQSLSPLSLVHTTKIRLLLGVCFAVV